MYLLLAVIAFAGLIFYGFTVYAESVKESDDANVKTKESDSENESETETDTKEFELTEEVDRATQEGKRALFAPLVALIVAIPVAIMINNLWSVNGIEAGDVAYAVVTGIVLFTFAYVYAIGNYGDSPWYKVFTIYVIAMLIILALAWWSNRNPAVESASSGDTTTSTATENTLDDEERPDCEPTTIMDELTGTKPCYQPPEIQ